MRTEPLEASLIQIKWMGRIAAVHLAVYRTERTAEPHVRIEQHA
jgi:hypothetical protein